MFLLLVTVLVAVYFKPFHHPGIHVTVQNSGRQPLRSVVLVVTGNRYSLGNIPPTNATQARVHCTGDSHLEIEYQDGEGNQIRLDAGGYFQPGDRGTIRVSIMDGGIEVNEQSID